MLAEAGRLTALAELMGMGALPGHERIVMLAGRLIRDGLLQQSALSPVDAVSSPERTAALTRLVLDVIDACQALVEHGVPAATVEEVDFTLVVRAREEVGDDPAALAGRRGEMLERLHSLDRR